MEDFGARAKDVDAFCREQAAACDLFVGIIGHRFGDGPKNGKESFTQREYRAAVKAKRPRLLFLAPDDFPIPANLWEPAEKIEAQAKFRKELRDGKDLIFSVGFTSPDDLAKQIAIGIHNHVLAAKRREEYLRLLRNETAHIDIRGLRVSGGSAYQFRIDELYTPLTTVLAPDERRENFGLIPWRQIRPLDSHDVARSPDDRAVLRPTGA